MILKKILHSVDRFWFAPSRSEPMALFRVSLGSLIFILLIISSPNWLRFYGPDALIPFDYAVKFSSNVYLSLFSIFESFVWIWLIYALSLIAALLFIFGWHTKLATLWLFLLFTSMENRIPALVNGQDQIIHLFLFLSLFADLGADHSLDNFLRSKEKPGTSYERSAWPLRLMQLSFALIYVFCGPGKLFDSVEWRDGTAIYYISLSDRWFRYPGAEIFQSLIVSRVLTYGSLLVEILFPYLVWIPRIRPYVVGTLAIFHLSIALTLAPSVFYFNIAMIAVLPIFMEPETCKKILERVSMPFFRFMVRARRS